MLDVLNRPGVWLRAGLNGALSGLDLPNAIASLPRGADHDFARYLFLIAEQHFLRALMATVKTESN